MKKSKLFKPKRQALNKRFNLGDKKTGRAKGYNYKWEQYRKEFLKHNPKCYTCGDNANEVDHAYPHKGDQALFWNPYNLLPLCKSCHSTATGLYDMKNPPDSEGKMKWISKCRFERRIEIKVVIVPIKVKV